MFRPIPPTRFYAQSAPLAAADGLFVSEITQITSPLLAGEISATYAAPICQISTFVYREVRTSPIARCAPHLSRGAHLTYREVRTSPITRCARRLSRGTPLAYHEVRRSP